MEIIAHTHAHHSSLAQLDSRYRCSSSEQTPWGLQLWRSKQSCSGCDRPLEDTGTAMLNAQSILLLLIIWPSKACSSQVFIAYSEIFSLLSISVIFTCNEVFVTVCVHVRAYWVGHSRLCFLRVWVRIFWAEAWTAAAPGSTVCRWEWSSPAHRSGPTATRGGSRHYGHDGWWKKNQRINSVSDWQTSDFMYAAAPFAALMITYGTRSPRFGALPASLFLILEQIMFQVTSTSFKNLLGRLWKSMLSFLKSYLSASSTCACLPAYSWAVRVSSLVITSWLMSMRLHRRSEITSLAWSTAPWGSLGNHILTLTTNQHLRVGRRAEIMNTASNAAVTTTGRLPVNEDLLQAGIDEIGHQGTVVSADGLNAFAVHLVVCFCIGWKVEARVPLLVDEQIWVIDLWKQSEVLIIWVIFTRVYEPCPQN